MTMSKTPSIARKLQDLRVNLHAIDDKTLVAVAPRGHIFAASQSATLIVDGENWDALLERAQLGFIRVDEGDYETRLEEMGVPLSAALA